MDNTRRLPPALVEHARAFLSQGRIPVEPKGAATVILLRDGAAYDDRARGGETAAADRAGSPSPEVYLLRRHLGMAFAGGMFAFPGGTVDPRDSDHAVAWAGPTPAEWGERLACDEPTARALVCAAVRETFEEAGVLLAGDSPESVVADTTGDEWERERAALVDRSLSFADFLERRGLVLRTDLLAVWAHWITPEFEPRRYDTRFFVAGLPPGQLTRDVSGEADHVAWMRPVDALAGVDAGEMAMLPPTYVAVRQIADFPSVEAVLEAAADRVVRAVTPGVEIAGDEGLLTLPPWALG